jgi:hypothetical protein
MEWAMIIPFFVSSSWADMAAHPPELRAGFPVFLPGPQS